ncbi:MAG: SUMF1/EgtB/PvdO family nonheme iron enzyme, partial [Planctomycetota bacterium]
TLRNAITATGYPWRVRDNGTNIEMVLIPPGTFDMGCIQGSNNYGCYPWEQPVHTVTLTNAFYLGRYEVTQAQWTAKMGTNPSFFQGASYPDSANRPVENVRWDLITTTSGGFLVGTGLRLPTEAEWEYACRAGTTTAFHGFTGYLNGTNDDTLVENIAWYSANASTGTRPVGGKAPNGLGLYDMSGNVQEWVSDWYSSSYYASSPSINPQGPATGTERGVRGGAWVNYTGGVRSSSRSSRTPDTASNLVGFRVARCILENCPPQVTAVTPNAGPIVGGVTITLSGTGLTGTTGVKIGGVSALSVTVTSPTTVTAMVPAGTVGPKTVELTTPSGTAVVPNGFTYLEQPTIAAVSPSSGPATGGTTITITGTNLAEATSVKVDFVAATSLTVVNANTLTAVTAGGTPGAKSVLVTTLGGTAIAEGAFTYVSAPLISAVSPSEGTVDGGTAITITGTNLLGTTGVMIGGVAATAVQVVNATTVTAVTPPSSTVVTQSLTLTTPYGTGFAGFTYVPWYTVLEQDPNPAIVTSAALRVAISVTGKPWRVRDNATQIEMVLIPPGSFNMGCSESNTYTCGGNESPVHPVTLTSAFYLGRYEVTQAQWQAKMGTNPSYFQSASSQVGVVQVPKRPVEQVSWDAIQSFLIATRMRLPTEAEWEYAYRAGTTTAFHGSAAYPNGTNEGTLVHDIAWFVFNAALQTRPVGEKAGNGFGVHDMGGNVSEWVNDWYGSTYYASSPTTNPPGPASGTYRVLRGGSWDDNSFFVRSSARNGNTPDLSNHFTGFRVARAPL